MATHYVAMLVVFYSKAQWKLFFVLVAYCVLRLNSLPLPDEARKLEDSQSGKILKLISVFSFIALVFTLVRELTNWNIRFDCSAIDLGLVEAVQKGLKWGLTFPWFDSSTPTSVQYVNSPGNFYILSIRAREILAKHQLGLSIGIISGPDITTNS